MTSEVVVNQTGGPGHDIYAGLMTPLDGGWSLKFLVHRFDSKFPHGDMPSLSPAYEVGLKVSVYPPEGSWDRSEEPFDLAREAAIAREIGRYKTAPDRILTNQRR